MPSVPFLKAQGCGNDFLILSENAANGGRAEDLVRAICDRHFGVGADGVYFLAADATPEADAEIHLYNSDGSRAELSGNGTRCVAAALVAEGRSRSHDIVRVKTGAGVRELRLLAREGNRFSVEMTVGEARVLPGPSGPEENTLDIWLGNPQCAVLVENFDFPWQERGRQLSRHPHFPAGTNVDFVRVVDRHTVEARFWERGAGHTLASGTGSSASAVAAIHSGRTDSPVTVRTEGGDLIVRWEQGVVHLTGPAELVCRGEFYWQLKSEE